MTWLITQLWVLMLVSFVIGAVMTYVILTIVVPHVDRLSTGLPKGKF